MDGKTKGQLQAEAHLIALYGFMKEGVLSVWTLEDKKSYHFPVRDINRCIETVMRLRNSYNVYCGVATRKGDLGEFKRGKNEDVSALPGVWVEIDIKGGDHAAGNLPSETDVQGILDTFPLEPSILVHSGGGLHCYWLFQEPATITSNESMKSAEAMLYRFQNIFIRLARAKGFHIDNTSDLARVLRIPGTYNRKSEPKPVETILFKPERRYSLHEMAKAIKNMETVFPEEPKEKADRRQYDGEIQDAKFPERIVQECQFIQDYLEHKDTAPYSEWMAALSIGSYCENGEELVHEWSEGHPGYSHHEVDRKYNEIRSNMKPRTCRSIQQEFGRCNGCPHFNKINSPIALGMRQGKEKLAITIESNEVDGVTPQDSPESTVIPLPFVIQDNALFKFITRKARGTEVEDEIMVSRIAPKIIKELSNVERNSVHYQIAWTDRGREKREVVPASTLSTKRELLTLADSGLPCNDLNYKDLISYFDKYLSVNQIEQSQMVERLGHIKNAFIHPLDSQGIEIIPNDIGERQLLEAFKVKGTADGWKKEVFDRIKHHKKVLFLVFSSFASVILRDLKVTPFIVDLSGSTSLGKTTALHAARSVWGSGGLINEWNATKVSIERKTGFLNSFPLYMDDTRKADERILQSIVYQFSGGRSKGRGSLKGSQSEMTWNNILISTGEVSLTDYANQAGGVAARIVSLVDQPFEVIEDDYFEQLYEAIDNNYGAIGLEFLQKWQTEKKTFIPEFHNFKDHYLKKSKGNEVLTRMSMYFAAVHFAGSVARKIFNLQIDLKLLDRLFDEVAGENKSLDKPKELLEQILYELDSSRKNIYYQYEPDVIKAIYHFNTICLTPNYLKNYLGTEEKMIRREWLKKGYTQKVESNGNVVDYKQVKHDGRKFNAVIINPDFIEEIGLDFSRDID